jgi:hypothetical protein
MSRKARWAVALLFIKKPLNLAEKSRMIGWRSIAPVQGQRCRWQTPRCHRTAADRQRYEGLGNNQRAPIP